ncbi:MAG: aldose 1-epimerase family protein [Rhodoferax sp.]|nr:aldose 1-epimerase family protein [Rhodoferax sp.]
MPETLHLNNGTLSAVVKLRGAELCSLQDRTTGEEFIWQNPTGAWAGSAPILFPVVGRVRNGNFTHQGQAYPMGIHGFAMRSLFDSSSRTVDSASLRFLSNSSTRACYPFDFALQVDFRLHGRTLEVQYTVRNQGSDTMYFSLGSHPAFALPLDQDSLSAWSVEFDQPEQPEVFRLAPDGALLATVPESFTFAPGNAVVLSDTLFKRDALIFKNIRSRMLTLAHRTTGQRLSVDTGGAPHLGLWAKPGEAYVCIEPWWGVDDDATTPLNLADKPAMQTLAPGSERRFAVAYRVAKV